MIGVAGSGKSTLAATLCECDSTCQSFTEAYREAISKAVLPGPSGILAKLLPDPVLSHLARAFGVTDHALHLASLKHPHVFATVGPQIKRYSNDDDRVDFVARKMLSLMERFATIDAHLSREATVLIDEGFAVCAGSVLHPPCSEKPVSQADLTEYISSVPTPDIVVFTRATPETCLGRCRARDGGVPRSWESLPDRSQLSHAERAAKMARAVADAYAAAGTVVIEVDTEELEVAEATEEAARALRATID